ncbi:PAS domain S-box protein [uncultured Methanoregula sp.]|uniref:PAS domain S-box protein n=1 Tax=uncultured Methanoregula sp. TaxID=1005933 RepID=UPI002AAB3896|nr:PAS domain S-box protein [uncultured Methanoregula sp.]
MFSVLYVDDEPDLLELGKLFLENSGKFSVTTAVSATEGLQLAAREQIDLILSDYQMPGMDGIAFLKEIRAQYPNLPFILFTGRGREEVVIEAINSGADFYLQKGGDVRSQFAELAHKITIAVERRQAVNALRDSEQRLADIINFLPDATFAIDTEGTVIAWNRAIEDVTGVPASEMIGKGDHAYAIPFYGHHRELLIDLVLESEEAIQRGRYAIVKKEGDVLIAETSAAQVRGVKKVFYCKASLLYNKDGNVVGAIESIRDITEARHAEDELRAAYEQITASEEELREQYDELKSHQDQMRLANEQITAQDEELRGQYEEMVYLQKQTDESQQMLQQVLNTVPARVFWKDMELQYLGCNEPFARDAGFSMPADLIGKTDFDMGWKEQAEAYRVDDRRVIETGIPKIGYEEPQTTPDGNRIWLRTSKIPLRDSGGKILGILGTYEDITSTVEAKEKLRLLKISVDRAYDEVFWLDFEGNIIYVNDSACRITGFPREELLGMKIYSLDPDFPPEVWNKFIVDLRRQGTLLFTTRHRKKDGTIINVEIMTSYAAEGTREFSFAFARDITARMREQEDLKVAYEQLAAGQQALRESEEMYRSVIENIQDIFYRTDLNGNIILSSPSALTLLGYSSLDEVLGKPIASFFYQPEKRGDLLRILSKKGKIEDYEVQLKRKDGTPVWVSTNSHYYLGPDGSITGVEGVYRDISRRHEIEEGLLAANEKLTAQTRELRARLEELEKAD